MDSNKELEILSPIFIRDLHDILKESQTRISKNTIDDVIS